MTPAAAAAPLSPDYPTETTPNDADATDNLLSTPSPEESPTPPQEGPAQGTPEVDHFAALSAVVPEHALDMTIARVVAAGGVEGVTFDPAGGMTPEQFTTHAQGHQAALQAIADQHVTAQGIDPEAFYTWANANRAKDVRALALQFAHQRDPAVFAPLMMDYARYGRGTRRG